MGTARNRLRGSGDPRCHVSGGRGESIAGPPPAMPEARTRPGHRHTSAATSVDAAELATAKTAEVAPERAQVEAPGIEACEVTVAVMIVVELVPRAWPQEEVAPASPAGLVETGVVAIDGTKLHANAGRDANTDYEEIAHEILTQADAVDREEDERYGPVERGRAAGGVSQLEAPQGVVARGAPAA